MISRQTGKFIVVIDSVCVAVGDRDRLRDDEAWASVDSWSAASGLSTGCSGALAVAYAALVVAARDGPLAILSEQATALVRPLAVLRQARRGHWAGVYQRHTAAPGHPSGTREKDESHWNWRQRVLTDARPVPYVDASCAGSG